MRAKTDGMRRLGWTLRILPEIRRVEADLSCRPNVPEDCRVASESGLVCLGSNYQKTGRVMADLKVLQIAEYATQYRWLGILGEFLISM